MGRTSLIKKIVIFFRLKFRDKLLIVETFILEGIARAVILIVPFNKIKKYIGKHKEETSFEIDNAACQIAIRVAWAVNHVSRNTPWESKCLVQALTAQNMLKRRKVSSTIYLGVKKNGGKMEAHAWLRCGQLYVTGGINKGEFTEVARFALYSNK